MPLLAKVDFDHEYNLNSAFLALRHAPDSQYQQFWICVDSEKDHCLARETPEVKLMAFIPQERNRALFK